MNKKIILNGWISPEGEIFECDFMGHKDSLYEIAQQKGFEITSDYLYCDLWNRGYIRFYGNPNCENFSISFDEQIYNKTNDKIEITEEQKMAQARLLKQLRY